MKLGIRYRLFLAILLAAGLAVVSMVVVMQWSLDRGFLHYIKNIEKSAQEHLVVKLEQFYSREGSWSYLQQKPAAWRQMVEASLPERGPGPPPDGPPKPGMDGPPANLPDMPPPPRPLPHFTGRFDQRLFLLDAEKSVIIGHPSRSDDSDLKPLHRQGRVVGYLGLVTPEKIFNTHQLHFLKQQKITFALAAAVLVVLSAGLSLLLANRLVRPIKVLAGATQDLASGRYGTRVPADSKDELGQLARSFNTLALTLDKNEQARRQWVADISHELRTPISILRGEIEALQDGIRAVTPESLRSLHGETERLANLVEDLYQLSLADLGALTYRKEALDMVALLDEALDAFGPEFRTKKIGLITEIPQPGTVKLFGDVERLHQLVTNLLHNALKYTDSGGRLVINLACHDNLAVLDLQDSAPGVPEEDLERLFDRLYRVDGSRNRAAGGAGLGLAICRSIVEAHEGKIEARISPLGGLWVRVQLPLLEDER